MAKKLSEIIGKSSKVILKKKESIEVPKEAEAKARENTKRFAETFVTCCEKAQMSLDTTSRHPKYSFAGGFIHLEVDERRLQATVSIRDGANDPRPLDMEPLVKHLRKEYERLFDRPFEAERFLMGVRKAYTAILKEEKRSPGDEVPLRRVAHRLSKNWSNFRLDEFNIDLSRAVKGGQPDKDGYRLHLGHTRDTRQGMLLHGFEVSGYVGFISFKKESIEVSKEQEKIIRIKTVKTISSLFPDIKQEDIYTSSGMLTKKGIVYLFWKHNKDKVTKPIKAELKDCLKDKSLFNPGYETLIDERFNHLCQRAFSMAERKDGKETRKTLIEGIQKGMEEVKQVIFNDLSLLDI